MFQAASQGARQVLRGEHYTGFFRHFSNRHLMCFPMHNRFTKVVKLVRNQSSTRLRTFYKPSSRRRPRCVVESVREVRAVSLYVYPLLLAPLARGWLRRSGSAILLAGTPQAPQTRQIQSFTAEAWPSKCGEFAYPVNPRGHASCAARARRRLQAPAGACTLVRVRNWTHSKGT